MEINKKNISYKMLIDFLNKSTQTIAFAKNCSAVDAVR